MKKAIIFFFIIISAATFAQKGTKLIAGSVGFRLISDKPSSDKYVYLEPKFGYQFSKTLTAGLDGAFIVRIRDNGNKIENTTTIQVGPFLRYTKPIAGIFSYFVDFSTGFRSITNSADDPNFTTVKTTGLYSNIVPAIAIDLKKGFCLNFSVGGLNFKTEKENIPDSGQLTTLEFSFGQSALFGISKNF